jgi:glycosyltransferase involved in cell wall biosynthesis
VTIANPIRVAHLTSAHGRYDVRIFAKMCRTAIERGMECALVVADGMGEEVVDGVRIIDAGASTGRLARMTKAPRRVLDVALELNADVYHLHDPELWTIAAALRKAGGAVIFDSHEDLPRQVMAKTYIPAALRRLASLIVKAAESVAVRNVDHVVGATPWITAKFSKYGVSSTCIANYAVIGEEMATPIQERPARIIYIGGISRRRGIVELVASLALARTRPVLGLAGLFHEAGLQIELEEKPAWTRVDYRGVLSTPQVLEELARSCIGICTIHPTPIDLEGLPVKLFEYMAAGLPVIVSAIPHWKAIVDDHDCGLSVDPTDPTAIAEAIDALIADRDRAASMGRNGRVAAETKYSWESQAPILANLYVSLAARRGSDGRQTTTEL